jgi:hypothetical protein
LLARIPGVVWRARRLRLVAGPAEIEKLKMTTFGQE